MPTTAAASTSDLNNPSIQRDVNNPHLPTAGVVDMLRSNGAKPNALLLEPGIKTQIVAARECADKALELGGYQEAIKQYDKIISLDPRDAKAYAERGELLLTQSYNGDVTKEKMRDDVRSAIADYTKAIELDPKRAEFFAGRAEAKRYRGTDKDAASPDFAGAIADYSKAIELEPLNTGLFKMRAVVKDCNGQNDEAIKDMNRAVEINPKDANNYTARGDIFRSGGKFKQACDDYSQALKINPTNPDPWHFLSETKLRCGDWKGCVEDGTKYLLAVGDPTSIASAAHVLSRGAQEFAANGELENAAIAAKFASVLTSHSHKRH